MCRAIILRVVGTSFEGLGMFLLDSVERAETERHGHLSRDKVARCESDGQVTLV